MTSGHCEESYLYRWIRWAASSNRSRSLSTAWFVALALRRQLRPYTPIFPLRLSLEPHRIVSLDGYDLCTGRWYESLLNLQISEQQRSDLYLKTFATFGNKRANRLSTLYYRRLHLVLCLALFLTARIILTICLRGDSTSFLFEFKLSFFLFLLQLPLPFLTVDSQKRIYFQGIYLFCYLIRLLLFIWYIYIL